MQIKPASKMAKYDDSITFHANTIQENKKILHDLRNKSYGIRKGREELKKLFNKLNHNCQIQSIKDGNQQNSTWRSKNVTNYTYGPIPGFPSGSWWGIRMDCSRDKVHNPFDEDIQNGPFGITSICTSNTNMSNEDIDLGDSLTLTGEKFVEDETQQAPFITNYKNQVPVRLVRCYNLLNKYAPKTGYRYDGLYAVVRFWVGVNTNKEKYYKFGLIRLLNQEPSPWNARRNSFDAKHSFSTVFPESRTLQDCPDHQILNAYKFRKKPYAETRQRTTDAIKFSESEKAGMIEKPKNTAESAIVTRHVFKKCNTSTENPLSPSTSSTSENKALLKIHQGSKAQSTNISIRTGLYDSSNSIQHDAKRNALTSFCRATKSVPVLKTNLLETPNVSNRDKNKADVKIDVTKNAHKYQGTDALNHKPNANTVMSSMEHKKKSEVDTSAITENGTSQSNNDTEKLSNNLNHSVFPYQSLNNDESKVTEHEMAKDNLQGLKPLELLDSLTPDKILHLIDNEKCHPLSKVLMGNMLGFTSEQSVTLRSFDKLHADVNGKENSEKKNFKAINDDLISSRCYKFRRRKRMPRKLLSKSDSKLQMNFAPSVSVLPDHCANKNVNEEKPKSLKNSPAKAETRPHTRHSVLNKTRKETTISLRVKRRNIAKSRENEGTVRSRLTNVQAIRASVKKHVNKKQRREIANLLIDAKIGPKVRGPRNRRLRCINSVYTKRPYEPFSTMIRTLNKHSLNSETHEQGTIFQTRNKLKKVKRRSHIKEPDTKYTESSTEKSDNKEVEVKRSNTVTSTPNRTRKRKFEATTSKTTNHSEVNGSLEDYCEGDSPKPYKIDAVTQCSLISHEITESSRSSLERMKFNDYIRLNERNGRPTCVKIERADSKHMKSEILEEYDISDDENYEVYVVRKGQNVPYSMSYPDEREMAKIVGYDFPSTSTPKVLDNDQPAVMQRASAFVPVNTVDSDVRIARLRSIGFKPITSEANNALHNENYSTSFVSKVVKQDVAEKYNKYTNEENSVVVYMDEELQYEEIENELEAGVDVLSVKKSESPLSRSSVVSSLDEPNVNRDNSEPTFTEYAALPDQDLEAPWHGWKKVVTSKVSYWIGW